MKDKLTIIAVTFNSIAILPVFLDRLFHSLGDQACRVLVCDNGSEDGTSDYLKRCQPRVETIRLSRNIGYGAALNQGIAVANTPYVALMNPDVFLAPGGFETLVRFLDQHPEAGGVSGAVAHRKELPLAWNFEDIFPDGKVAVHFGYETIFSRALFYSGLMSHLGQRRWLVPWQMVRAADAIAVSRLNGCFGVFRKKALERADLFDPRFFLYFEEDDIGLRLHQRGYRLYVTDRVPVVHLSGSGSAGSRSVDAAACLLASQYLFFAKHRRRRYCRLAFAVIWAVITAVIVVQVVLRGKLDANLIRLWLWHSRRLSQRNWM